MFPTPSMILKKFQDAVRGISVTSKEELSFKMELFAGIILVGFIYIMWPLEDYELMGLLITYGLVLITELVNTSLEAALERIHPERHELIGRAKDIAAGSVVLAILLLAGVITLIIF